MSSTRRTRSLGRQDFEQICAAHREGLSVEAIAWTYGVTPRRVRMVLREWCGRLQHLQESA